MALSYIIIRTCKNGYFHKNGQIAGRGKVRSPESRAKAGAKLKGKQPFLGMKHSNETRAKMRIAAVKVWEQRLANGFTGRKHTQEERDSQGIRSKAANAMVAPEVRSARAYKAWETKRAKENKSCQAL
jgi:hypothetical protein